MARDHAVYRHTHTVPDAKTVASTRVEMSEVMEPQHANFVGKMNFYLSAVDDLLRHPDDKPSVGLISCN